MARIDDIKAELTSVRQEITNAEQAAALSTDGQGLTRQRLDHLRAREAELSWQLQEALTGSPFGRSVVRNTGGRY